MSFRDFLTSKAFFKQLVIALILLLVIIFALLQWIKFSTNHGQEIKVPALQKMTIEKAGETLEYLDLEYTVLDTVDYRPNFPAFTVVEQDPLPNATVKEGRKIYIKVNSGGYSTISLPNLIQKTYRAILPTLKSNGLEEGKKTYKPYLAKDVVLEVWQGGKKLSPGDKVQKASKIDLVLGDGSTGFDEEELDSPDTPVVPQNDENTEGAE